MKFDVLTLFPDMFSLVLGDSIIGRAKKAGLIETNFINIRDFSKNKHKKTDDYPYSGGGGMLMMPEPIYDAYLSTITDEDKKPYVIYMSPQGKTFNQEKAKELSKKDHIVILCGHYEGVDQRVLDLIVDEEISIGDFVLTGGEIPAMAITDAIARMLPGVLSDEECFSEESHFAGLLEYPHYTRPAVWHDREVPEILLSGHHANIKKWRREQSIIRTLKKRPDMIADAPLTTKERAWLDVIKNSKEA